MVKKVNRFEVWLVELDPTKGSEIRKTRPCLIISINAANKYLNTVTIVPLTSKLRNYPTRVNCVFQNREGQAMVDQIRGVDKIRLKKKLGTMNVQYCKVICDTIVEAYKWE